jgi:hypothetical protein
VTTTRVPSTSEWSALVAALRRMSGMPRNSKSRCARVGVYARVLEAVGARSLAVSPPGQRPTNDWQWIGRRFRHYCPASYAAAYDSVSRIVAGADVDLELARFARVTAGIQITAWVKVKAYGGHEKWVAPEEAAELDAKKQHEKREEAAKAIAQRAPSQERARTNLDDAERKGRNLLDEWVEIGERLYRDDPCAFRMAFNEGMTYLSELILTAGARVAAAEPGALEEPSDDLAAARARRGTAAPPDERSGVVLPFRPGAA